MKKLFISFLAVFLLFTACSCGGSSTLTIPEGMSAGDLILDAEAVIALLNQKDYEAVHAMLREDVAASITVSDIEEAANKHLSDAGEFKEYTASTTFGQTAEETGEEYAIASVIAKYKEKSATFNIGFDTDMQLIGLSIQSK